MGLFDRLFGKKEETEKVLPSSEEVTESTEVEETVKEEPAATLNDRKSKKSLIWRLTTKSLKRGLQPLINLFQPSLKKSRQRNLLLKI